MSKDSKHPEAKKKFHWCTFRIAIPRLIVAMSIKFGKVPPSPPDQFTVKVAGLVGGSAATLLVGASVSTVVVVWAVLDVACRLPTWSVATLKKP